jgi:hypothetical protein
VTVLRATVVKVRDSETALHDTFKEELYEGCTEFFVFPGQHTEVGLYG